MKLIVIISLLAWNVCLAQTSGPITDSRAAAVKEQATKMGQALVKGDYATFIHYTYPGLVKMAGGADQLTAQLGQLMKEMRTRGMLFKGISVGGVSKIVANAGVLQCTVPQYTEIQMQGEKMKATSTLIGVSEDGGRSWTFIDTSTHDKATIRKLMPGLSGEIVIPPAQPPVRPVN